MDNYLCLQYEISRVLVMINVRDSTIVTKLDQPDDVPMSKTQWKDRLFRDGYYIELAVHSNGAIFAPMCEPNCQYRLVT